MRTMPSRMNVVRKDEKVAKLTDFLDRYLSARRASVALDASSSAACDTCQVVARSADSPVTKVLIAALPEFSALGLSIKALYAMPGDVSPFLSPPLTCAPPRIEIRRASDVRLLEAHELLILGPRTAWVGDCMRREPANGDSYEFYADDCIEMAAAAQRSFDRALGPGEALPPTPRRRQPDAPASACRRRPGRRSRRPAARLLLPPLNAAPSYGHLAGCARRTRAPTPLCPHPCGNFPALTGNSRKVLTCCQRSVIRL